MKGPVRRWSNGTNACRALWASYTKKRKIRRNRRTGNLILYMVLYAERSTESPTEQMIMMMKVSLLYLPLSSLNSFRFLLGLPDSISEPRLFVRNQRRYSVHSIQFIVWSSLRSSLWSSQHKPHRGTVQFIRWTSISIVAITGAVVVTDTISHRCSSPSSQAADAGHYNGAPLQRPLETFHFDNWVNQKFDLRDEHFYEYFAFSLRIRLDGLVIQCAIREVHCSGPPNKI